VQVALPGSHDFRCRCGIIEETGAHALVSRSGGEVMKIFIATCVVFALAIFGMAIGVILGNCRLRGSCGGLSSLKDDNGEPLCGSCETPAEDCPIKDAVKSAPGAEGNGNDDRMQDP